MLILLNVGLTEYGWERSKADGSLQVEWELQENVQKIQQRLDFVLAGCSCKKGCSTSRCRCVKNSKSCGPGCRCFSCKNVPSTLVDYASGEDLEEDEDSSINSDESNTDDEDDQDEQEVMEAVTIWNVKQSVLYDLHYRHKCCI